jgi:hypothetical protein
MSSEKIYALMMKNRMILAGHHFDDYGVDKLHQENLVSIP